MRIITDISAISHSEWNEFVLTHSGGTIFQSPHFYQVYQETRNNEPLVLFVVDSDDKIRGLLLAVIQKEYSGVLGALTARSVIFGGPLLADGQGEASDRLLTAYDNSIRKRAVYSQIRNFQETNACRDIMDRHGFCFEDHLNIIIDLRRNPEEIFASFSQDRRWEIRKGYKKNVVVEEVNSPEQIPIFYSFVKNAYIRNRIPAPDISLVEAVYRHLAGNGLGKFFLAGVDGKYIASHSVLGYGDKLICWFGGLDREYGKYFPYEILIWESLKWGAENGYASFDFQGAGKPGREYGVRDFKKRFGGELVNWGRYEKVHRPIVNIISKSGYKAWQLTYNMHKNSRKG